MSVKVKETKATKKATAVKQETTAVKQEKTAVKKTSQIVFLNEGVTGKKLQDAKIETNKAIKTEIRSFSFAQKYCLEFDRAFLSSFKKFNPSDLTPKNLLSLRTQREKDISDKNGFSAWLFMSLVKRYYATK